MVQTRPTHAEPQGPIQGDARSDLDRPYADKRADAQHELDDSLTGRDGPYGVARDDTGMKNPDGDLAAPSAMPANARPVKNPSRPGG